MAFASLGSLGGRLSSRFGALYTLRVAVVAAGVNAYTAGASTVSYHIAKGRARFYRPAEIRGGVLERDQLIVLDPASLSATPKPGDKIAVGVHTADAGATWLHVVNVYAPLVGDNVAGYRLQVRE